MEPVHTSREGVGGESICSEADRTTWIRKMTLAPGPLLDVPFGHIPIVGPDQPPCAMSTTPRVFTSSHPAIASRLESNCNREKKEDA
jgi:hypothetical protein